MKIQEWFNKNTNKAQSYSDIKKLVKAKRAQKQTISLCLPSLNEHHTIGKVITVMKKNLMDKYPLIDEIIVIDSGSTDKTVEIAREAGAQVYMARDILKKYRTYKGKGENLWKSLYVANGSIIVWLDTDIKNIHPRFVYGLVGPLLMNKDWHFCKGFYTRPLKEGSGISSHGGGRVTELLIRPLFNQYFPRLSGFVQPLSGEYAGRRKILDKLEFFTGYGIETSILIDIEKVFGLETMCQTDLDKRVHRNQTIDKLSKMSYGILQVFAERANSLGKLIQVEDIRKTYRTFQILEEGGKRTYKLNEEIISDRVRPPMVTIPQYRKKFEVDPYWSL